MHARQKTQENHIVASPTCSCQRKHKNSIIDSVVFAVVVSRQNTSKHHEN